MRKILATLAATALLGVPIATVGASASSPSTNVYLGSSVAKYQSGQVWQSSLFLNEGCSSVRYGYENGANTQKFLRLANFDGATALSTGVCIALDNPLTTSSLTVAFSYRLFEGVSYYDEKDTVLEITAGDKTIKVLFSDLTANSQGDYTWKQKSVSFAFEQAQTLNRLTVRFYFADGKGYGETDCCLDLDGIQVNGNSSACTAGSFDFISIENGEKIASYGNESTAVSEKQGYTLSGQNAFDYACNTDYSHFTQVNFNDGQNAKALARSGSSGTYRGATSVNAGEGDSYAIYDSSSNNTYIRLANYNGTSATSSRFVNYFYDNKSGTMQAITGVQQLHYSFSYRVYMDDYIRAGIDGNETAFTLISESSTYNKSGVISFDSLVINEEGDPTWHTLKGSLWIRNTKEAKNISVVFNGFESASSSPKCYADVDNLFISNEIDGENYAHLNGTFEGLVEKESVLSAMGSALTHSGVFGPSAEKVAISEVDAALKLNKGQSFSLQSNWDITSNVYCVAFDVLEGESELTFYFSGRGGEKVTVNVGEDYSSNDNKLKCVWKEENGKTKGILYYVRTASEKMRSLDVVNSGENAVVIDDVSVGQVSKVCATAGDYTAFLSTLDSLKADYQSKKDGLRKASVLSIEKALVSVRDIQANSSQEKMDGVLAVLSSKISSAQAKADLTELNKQLAEAEKVLITGEKAYKANGWTRFKQKLLLANLVNEESSQAEVNLAASELKSAINLLEKSEDNTAAVTVAVASAGGAIGVGGVIGSVALIRRKKR